MGNNKKNDLGETEVLHDRKHYCECDEEEKDGKDDKFAKLIKSCIKPISPCGCPQGSCTCPAGSCTCPPGSCTCPAGSCTCPDGSCTCPPGSCTCPAGSCTCPPGSCTCPAGSCTCPEGSCACPPGSCTCPEGICPQTTELVQNPSFEIPCTDPAECDVFASWTGENINADNNEPFTGNIAANIGTVNPDDATLEQTICNINPGCPYEFSFSTNPQNLSGNGQFTAQVFWQPSNTPAIDPAVNPIVIDERFSGNSYVFIKRITTIAPPGTTCARILFTKTGTGSVLVDDVSFRG